MATVSKHMDAYEHSNFDRLFEHVHTLVTPVGALVCAIKITLKSNCVYVFVSVNSTDFLIILVHHHRAFSAGAEHHCSQRCHR